MHKYAGCLLERNLPRFAELFTADTVTSVPTHYREALALYATLDTCFLVPQPDEATAFALDDFLAEMEQADNALPEDRLRRRFGNTYWYYYFFAE